MGSVDHRLTAGDDDEPHTPKLFGLGYDASCDFPIQPLGVLSAGVGVTAFAVEVTTLAGADDDEPGWPGAMLSLESIFELPAIILDDVPLHQVVQEPPRHRIGDEPPSQGLIKAMEHGQAQ